MRIQEFKLDTGSWQTKTSKDRSVSESETGFDMIFQTVQTEQATSSPTASVQTSADRRLRTEAAERRPERVTEKEPARKEEAQATNDISSESAERSETAETAETVEPVEKVSVPEEQEAAAETPEATTGEDTQAEEAIAVNGIGAPIEAATPTVPEVLPGEEGMVLDSAIPSEEAANPQAEVEIRPGAAVEEMDIPVETRSAEEGEGMAVPGSSERNMESVDIPEEPEAKPTTPAAEKQDLPKRQAVVPQEQTVKTEVSAETMEGVESQMPRVSEGMPKGSGEAEKKTGQAENQTVFAANETDSENETQVLPKENEVRVEAAVKGKPRGQENAGDTMANNPLAEESPRQAAVTKEPVNTTSANITLESMVPVETASEVLPASQSGKQQPQTLSDLTVGHTVHAEKQATVETWKAGAASSDLTASETQPQANLDRVVKAAQTAVRGGSSSVQLRLDPPEMGLLRVEIRQSASGLHLQLQATSTEAHQMLQKSSHELRAALEMQGLGAAKIDIQLRLDLRNESSEQGSSNGQSYPQSQQQQEGQPQSFQSPFSQDFGSEYGQGGFDSGSESAEVEPGEAVLSGTGPGVSRGDGWQETQFHRLDVQV